MRALQQADHRPGKRGTVRTWCVFLALAGGAVFLTTGCDEDQALVDFKNASATTLAEGLKTVFNGLIDGAFAALFNPPPTS